MESPQPLWAEVIPWLLGFVLPILRLKVGSAIVLDWILSTLELKAPHSLGVSRRGLFPANPYPFPFSLLKWRSRWLVLTLLTLLWTRATYIWLTRLWRWSSRLRPWHGHLMWCKRIWTDLHFPWFCIRDHPNPLEVGKSVPLWIYVATCLSLGAQGQHPVPPPIFYNGYFSKLEAP